MGLHGVVWNPITKLFEADNQVWNDLIKTNPSAIQWKTRPISQYYKLKELWGKDRAADENPGTTKAKAQKWWTPLKIKGEIVIDSIHHIVEDEDQTTMKSFDLVSSYNASSSKSQGVNATKKRRIEELLIAEMNGIKNVMDRVVDVLLAIGNSILERSRPRIYSEAEVNSELERMKLDDAVKLEAYEFLTADQVLVRTMFGLPAHIPKNWLFRKLYGAN